MRATRSPGWVSATAVAARKPAPPPPTTSTSHVNRSMTVARKARRAFGIGFEADTTPPPYPRQGLPATETKEELAFKKALSPEGVTATELRQFGERGRAVHKALLSETSSKMCSVVAGACSHLSANKPI